jgi:L-threonylcarbamoyladenylate synthase
MSMKEINLKTAIELIQREEVILHGTETLLGFCGLATSESAAETIKQLKGRDNKKGFIILTNTLDAIKDWIIPLTAEQQQQITERDTPTTWLVPKSDLCPKHLTSAFPTLAIRVPKHSQIQELIHQIGAPVISTSANISQEPPSTDIIKTSKVFPSIPVLKPILAMTGTPSNIIDLSSHHIVR